MSWRRPRFDLPGSAARLWPVIWAAFFILKELESWTKVTKKWRLILTQLFVGAASALKVGRDTCYVIFLLLNSNFEHFHKLNQSLSNWLNSHLKSLYRSAFVSRINCDLLYDNLTSIVITVWINLQSELLSTNLLRTYFTPKRNFFRENSHKKARTKWFWLYKFEKYIVIFSNWVPKTQNLFLATLSRWMLL